MSFSPHRSKQLFLFYMLSMTFIPLIKAVCPYEECFCSSGNGVSCSGSNFKSVPPLKTGDDVKKVNMLFFTSTEITEIPDNSLPANLTSVHLTYNPISNISPNAFAASADTLINIVFGNANFSKLPDALLPLNSLLSLSVQDTPITDWNVRVLTHIGPSLKSLSLLNVGLESWPQWFHLFPSLTTMYFSNSSITTIPDDAFNLLKNNDVIAIIITYAKLSEIPRAFLELPSVDHISLEGNNINFLSNVPKTTFLGLAKNQISNASNLAEALLPVADTLESIELKSNHLSVIPDLSKMYKLTKVDLSQNQISDHNLGSFPPSVGELQLSGNQLSSVPLAVAGITNLTKLDLSFNMISEILSNSFPKQLLTLDLSGNKILKIMPGSFPAQLKTLDLSLNNITEITPGSFPERLTELKLSDNAISQIRESDFPKNSSLLTLNLARNPISVIARSAFQSLKELKTIDLGGTALSEIPLALTSLPNLQELYMVNIPSLTCTCPVDSGLHQWFKSKNIETWSPQGKQSRCNGTTIYGRWSSLRISEYLYNQTCDKIITTPIPNTSTTDDGNNGASSLIQSLQSFFLMCSIMGLNALVFFNV